MPPARKSASKTSTSSSGGVRARAAARSSATRREVEQSIARFEKRLDEANDALKTLSGHLGSTARGSYKEVTAKLTALRSTAVRTNKAALKDFDKLRGALTKSSSSSSATRSSKKSSGSSRSTSRKTASRKPASRSTASRSTAKRSTTSRSRAKKS